MDNINLNDKWAILSGKEITSGYKSLILSSECKSDLFIGLNHEHSRCLILSPFKKITIDFKPIKRENVLIEYFQDSNYLVLKLLNNSFNSLFDDLILSIFNKIKNITESEELFKEFIQTFLLWDELFISSDSNKLSYEEIKGLFGELLYLKEQIEDKVTSNVNEIVQCWTGPFDKRHDFTFDSKDVEVKTKVLSKLDISISSEYQLEKNLDKDIELVVISVLEHDGITLEDLVRQVKLQIQTRSGDHSTLFRAIAKKGLSQRNLSDYNDIQFLPHSQTTYDCSKLAFPKIVRSNLPQELSKVRYNIRVSSLSEFIISENNY